MIYDGCHVSYKRKVSKYCFFTVFIPFGYFPKKGGEIKIPKT